MGKDGEIGRCGGRVTRPFVVRQAQGDLRVSELSPPSQSSPVKGEEVIGRRWQGYAKVSVEGEEVGGESWFETSPYEGGQGSLSAGVRERCVTRFGDFRWRVGPRLRGGGATALRQVLQRGAWVEGIGIGGEWVPAFAGTREGRGNW